MFQSLRKHFQNILNSIAKVLHIFCINFFVGLISQFNVFCITAFFIIIITMIPSTNFYSFITLLFTMFIKLSCIIGIFTDFSVIICISLFCIIFIIFNFFFVYFLLSLHCSCVFLLMLYLFTNLNNHDPSSGSIFVHIHINVDKASNCLLSNSNASSKNRSLVFSGLFYFFQDCLV